MKKSKHNLLHNRRQKDTYERKVKSLRLLYCNEEGDKDFQICLVEKDHFWGVFDPKPQHHMNLPQVIADMQHFFPLHYITHANPKSNELKNTPFAY